MSTNELVQIARNTWLPIYAIAKNSFREALRNKVLASIVVSTFIIMGLGTLIGEMSLHNEVRVATNTGLFSTTIFTFILAIYSSVTLVHSEFERRTVYTILSKPIQRWQFLVGKFFGVSLLCAVVVLVLGLTSCGLVVYQGGDLNPTFFSAYLMVQLQAMIVVSITITFSTFMGVLIAGLATAGIFIAGNLLTQVDQAIAMVKESSPFVAAALKVVAMILPNLEALNLSTELTYAVAIPITYLLDAIWYTCSYILGVLLVGMVIFERKDFQ